MVRLTAAVALYNPAASCFGSKGQFAHAPARMHRHGAGLKLTGNALLVEVIRVAELCLVGRQHGSPLETTGRGLTRQQRMFVATHKPWCASF